MLLKTRWTRYKFIALDEDPEHLTRISFIALPSCEMKIIPTGLDKNTVDFEELMAKRFMKISDRMDIDRNSTTGVIVATGHTAEGAVNQNEVGELLEATLTEHTNKLDAKIAQGTEKALVGIAENLENDHNLAFVRKELKRGTYKIPSMMDENKVYKAFEGAVL